MKSQKNIGYRADVDGLRAVAVLLVIAFHSFESYVPAGFIGVDIFFVISGYLITRIIAPKLVSADFDVVDFYRRRVARIFPALLVVLAACLLFGAFSQYPDEYKQLTKHVLAGGLFVSNFAYMGEAGYFDATSAEKPLQHLWSLAVEEQFYLVWPLVLWLTYRLRINVMAVAILLVVFSFGLSVYWARIDTVNAYYSPTSRFWEIGVGCLVALKEQSGFKGFTNTTKTTLSAAAILMIIASVSLINRYRPFPGYWALLPVIATSFILIMGHGSSQIQSVLKNKFLVWLGLISYPLYLWHWPVIVFADVEFPSVDPTLRRMLCVAISVLAAWMTFRFVENPIKGIGATKSVPRLSFAMFSMLIASTIAFVMQGLPSRLAKDTNETYTQFIHDKTWDSTDEDCLRRFSLRSFVARGQQVFCRAMEGSTPVGIALIGDSTANSLYPGFEAIAKKTGQRVVNVGNGSCPPMWGINGLAPWSSECGEVNSRVKQLILESSSIHTVVLSFAAWDIDKISTGSVNPTSSSTLEQRVSSAASLLLKTIKIIESSGKRVILMYDTPNFGINPRECIVRPLGFARSDCLVPEERLHLRQPYLELWEKEIELKRIGAHACIFKLSDHLMDANGSYRMISSTGQSYFRDSHHLSQSGSLKFAKSMAKECHLIE